MFHKDHVIDYHLEKKEKEKEKKQKTNEKFLHHFYVSK